MKLTDNPSGDHIKASGPNNEEVNAIRQMVADGATVPDLYSAFPSIERVALKRWHVSLTTKGTIEAQMAAAAAVVSDEEEARLATVKEAGKKAAEIIAAAEKAAAEVVPAKGKKADPLR
jgi:hypothetical protein